MKKYLSVFLVIVSLSLVGARCSKQEVEEVVVNKEYSTSTAFEVVKKTGSDLRWHEAWDWDISNGWAKGGKKWVVYSQGEMKGDGLYYYHGVDQQKWGELKASHCTADNWVETKFGKTCCNNKSMINATSNDWHLMVFPEPLWAALFMAKNDNQQCSKSIEILNVFFNNLKDAE
jgi:hypothetical protein